MAMSLEGRRDRMAGINVTPLADVIIVLLIIFMVTTPLIERGRVHRLPFAESAALKKESAPTVWITADAMPYFGEIPVPDPEILREQLRRAIASAGGDPVVYVKAEAGLPFAAVARVVDQCREAGAREVALIVESRRLEN